MTEEAAGNPVRLVIDDTARDPSSKIWYALPGGYFDVPIDALDPAPGSEQETQLAQALALILDLAPEDQRDRYTGALRDVRFMAGQMRSEGVIACSLGMHYADDGSSASSVFTVALREVAWAPAKITAVRAVSLRECAENVELLTLPGGRPASITDTMVTMPALEGIPGQELYQCNLYVPAPSGTQLGVLTLSTTAVDSRKHYRDLMEGIAHTVSFHDPLPEIERAARGDADDGAGGVADDIASDFG
ncbi:MULTISPECIES: hypothetical protein [unclassified Streptomyces]|uniref:hypothetical protein n=1 Tax=unclassified Streptomyces TaxID=2593676 RepID=UPI002365CDC8|nr:MULTISPECIES: hypothetical protein [unclassified Streptomyces]MDF3143270.1 hypothetical protein [Streptomyces sp. T21Q-yed]WDF39516.1 hypothetical protein PBV52_23290 [Streptomyces sp. T12]